MGKLHSSCDKTDSHIHALHDVETLYAMNFKNLDVESFGNFRQNAIVDSGLGPHHNAGFIACEDFTWGRYASIYG